MTDSWDRTYPNSGVEIGKYIAVTLEADGDVAIAAANGLVLGICQRHTPADVPSVALKTGGYTKAIASASGINPGDKVKAAANGRVTRVGGEAASTVIQVLGIAETGSTAAGDIVEILIDRHVVVA